MARFDAFQQFLDRLVGGVLGDELAGEGAGEEGRRELGHLSVSDQIVIDPQSEAGQRKITQKRCWDC